MFLQRQNLIYKAIADQIPKNYKKSVKNRDKELLKVQRHVINVGDPLTALHDLLESKQELSHDQLLNLVERALCLLGNATNSISVLPRSKILYAVNPTIYNILQSTKESKPTSPPLKKYQAKNEKFRSTSFAPNRHSYQAKSRFQFQQQPFRGKQNNSSH